MRLGWGLGAHLEGERRKSDAGKVKSKRQRKAMQGLMRPSSAILLLLLLRLSDSDCATVPSSGSGLTIRYFAYGANLATSVREGRRKLSPLSTEVGLVRDARLAFNMIGFGPAEPAFASLQPMNGEECHGGVFELEVGDWVKLCASEGVPFGYTVRQVDVELYGGSKVPAYTLVGGAPFDLPPSERYLGLIREGAEELGLTRAWQDRLAKIPTAPFGNAPQPRDESFERRPGSTFI